MWNQALLVQVPLTLFNSWLAVLQPPLLLMLYHVVSWSGCLWTAHEQKSGDVSLAALEERLASLEQRAVSRQDSARLVESINMLELEVDKMAAEMTQLRDTLAIRDGSVHTHGRDLISLIQGS